MVLNGKNRDFDNFRSFLIFEFVFWAQEGRENDPEVRAVILTKFGPKRSHLDPIQANFYGFWVPDLCTCLPMSACGSEKNDHLLI